MRENPEEVEASPTFEKVVAMYGDRLSSVGAAALEQEKKIWATGSMWSNESPIGEAMFGLGMSGFSPAQKRVMALVEVRANRRGGEHVG